MRNRIDEIDRVIAKCLAERMELAKRIGEEKKRSGKPILDELREREVLERSEFPSVWRAILDESRFAQLKLCLDKHIVLVGVMGSGKTTVGRVLAQMLGVDWVDTDDGIAEQFSQIGEEKFRELESVALARALEGELKVVSTGGGVVLSEENREAMKKAHVFFLHRPIEIIKSTVCGEKRPLFGDLERTYKERLPLYKEVADFEVSGNRPPEDIAKQMLRLLESALPRL